MKGKKTKTKRCPALLDIVGPRCLDCIFCAPSFDNVRRMECHCNPPTIDGDGCGCWPTIPTRDIQYVFCGSFISADTRQTLADILQAKAVRGAGTRRAK